MDTSKISVLANGFKTAMIKYTPEILTGIGISGMISTAILAVKMTPKAIKLIEEEKEEKELDKLPVIDVVKVAWKCYIPPVIIGCAAIGCIIGANSINFNRNAALAAAYSLSESALRDYREKVIETIGEKKEQTVQEAVAKKKLDEHPVSDKEVIITGTGETLCYDEVSGRYFKSDIESLRRIENELNRQMRYDMYISLNEFYSKIGLKDITLGDELGWNIDKGYIEMRFTPHIAENGQPCIFVGYVIAPKHYDDLYH